LEYFIGIHLHNFEPFIILSIAKSTLSNHFRILRESGMIYSRKEGTQFLNTLRSADLEARFPGLLDAVLHNVEEP
jgi:DNA-binding transcriptional ArsR family regulator